ncbi:MAG: cytochrome c biogenesis protein CcdA [Flavobacteriaceae bacterium]
MFRKRLLGALLFLNSISLLGQFTALPLQWSKELIQESDSVYRLEITALIEDGWHLYSQFTPEGGSLPTELEFIDAGVAFELLGKTEESETETAYSDVFEVDERFFKKRAVFTQKIKPLQDVYSVEVMVYYQVCKEVCIPGEERMEFVINPNLKKQSTANFSEENNQNERLIIPLINNSVNDPQSKETGSQPMDLSLVLLGFLGGLIALLTPCVFPMIPLTVSFFSSEKNKGKTKKLALFYSTSIVLIFVLLSLPFHIYDSIDPQFFNRIATNVYLNLLFFVVLLLFALSLFGLFELNLPSSWSTRLDGYSSKFSGFAGSFFMALTLVIVSFSCTGPVLGGLLGSTALVGGQVAMNLTLGMLGFGLALAIPFGLFAWFPNGLKALPKSGAWMNTAKGVLGFVELALAFKFLSNADLVSGWGVLYFEIFLIIWIIISIALLIFLMLKINFKMLKNLQKGVWVLIYSGLLLFTINLSNGLLNKGNVALVGAFIPPDFYSISSNNEEQCPLGLDCYKDFDEGMAEAKRLNKPVLLDFTGWSCVNCRKMENDVWRQKKVYDLLQNEVVLISLYIDDRAELSEEEQFVVSYRENHQKEIRTIGDKWSAFQVLNFGYLSQPFYVLISPEYQILNSPIQYTDSESYFRWLDDAIRNFKAKYEFEKSIF